MGCDRWISVCFVCFCVSRFVVCDRNYDWRRQRKTQLWKRFLNFRVCMFVKSAVTGAGFFVFFVWLLFCPIIDTPSDSSWVKWLESKIHPIISWWALLSVVSKMPTWGRGRSSLFLFHFLLFSPYKKWNKSTMDPDTKTESTFYWHPILFQSLSYFFFWLSGRSGGFWLIQKISPKSCGS